jgi:hypothetical protein
MRRKVWVSTVEPRGTRKVMTYVVAEFTPVKSNNDGDAWKSRTVPYL